MSVVCYSLLHSFNRGLREHSRSVRSRHDHFMVVWVLHVVVLGKDMHQPGIDDESQLSCFPSWDLWVPGQPYEYGYSRCALPNEVDQANEGAVGTGLW